MNTKLYKDDLQVREISIEEFDAMEGDHVFSDKYENKKKLIMDALKQKGVRRKTNKALKVAVAAMALIVCSGTVLAMNGDYLKKLYESRMNGISEKYVDREFMEGEYELPIDVTTDTENDLLTFEVLQADKGEHTISFAVVVTVNHPESYNDSVFYSVSSDLTLTGMEDTHWTTGDGWTVTTYADGMAQTLGLEKNQILEIMEYQYDESVDLSQVESLQVNYRYVDKVQEVQGAYGQDLEMVEIDHNHVWTVSVPLQQDYEDYVVEVGKTYKIGENEIKMKTIRLSPLGLDFVYENLSDSRLTPIGYIEESSVNIKLKMDDGHEISMNKVSEGSGSCFDDEENKCIKERFNFKVPIDIEQIVGVELDGELIEIQ